MKIGSDLISKWDHRFLALAKHISQWSLDPSTKVGAVITSGKRVVSVGYNGFPQGIADDDRLNDRELKYQLIVHGERNAIIFTTEPLGGCTLYTHPFMPCPACAGMVIQAGIKRVVTWHSDNERWVKPFEITKGMFDEAKVELHEVYTVPIIEMTYEYYTKDGVNILSQEEWSKLQQIPPFETVGDKAMEIT